MHGQLTHDQKRFLVRSAQCGRELFVVAATDERHALERANWVVQYTARPWENRFFIQEANEEHQLPQFLEGYFELLGMGGATGHH